MIRVREIDGRVIVGNDPDAEAEFQRSQAENKVMFSYLAKTTKERVKRREQDNQHIDKVLQAALSPAPPPRIEPDPPITETKQDVKARRYQMCIDAGLPMPDNDFAELPTGIGELAKREGISKQAFSKSVKSHIAKQKR